MNPLFIFVSLTNSGGEISKRIEENFFSIDKCCQEWSVDFLFFPILIHNFGYERIYDTWPIMRDLSLEDIYERTIQAYSHELTINSDGIIVIRDNYPPEFITLEERNLLQYLFQLPEAYGIYKVTRGYGINGRYFGGPEPQMPNGLFEFR